MRRRGTAGATTAGVVTTDRNQGHRSELASLCYVTCSNSVALSPSLSPQRPRPLSPHRNTLVPEPVRPQQPFLPIGDTRCWRSVWPLGLG